MCECCSGIVVQRLQKQDPLSNGQDSQISRYFNRKRKQCSCQNGKVQRPSLQRNLYLQYKDLTYKKQASYNNVLHFFMFQRMTHSLLTVKLLQVCFKQAAVVQKQLKAVEIVLPLHKCLFTGKIMLFQLLLLPSGGM